MMFYISTKFSENISKGFRVTDRTVGSTLGWLHISKKHNNVRTVGGVMVLDLCTLSDDALFLYQVS